MAIDPKVTARSAAKKASKAKKLKMPTASTKDLKAIEVAGFGKGGRTDALIDRFFRGTAYGSDGGFYMYMDFRDRGLSPSKALEEVWDASNSESLQG